PKQVLCVAKKESRRISIVGKYDRKLLNSVFSSPIYYRRDFVRSVSISEAVGEVERCKRLFAEQFFSINGAVRFVVKSFKDGNSFKEKMSLLMLPICGYLILTYKERTKLLDSFSSKKGRFVFICKVLVLDLLTWFLLQIIILTVASVGAGFGGEDYLLRAIIYSVLCPAIIPLNLIIFRLLCLFVDCVIGGIKGFICRGMCSQAGQFGQIVSALASAGLSAVFLSSDVSGKILLCLKHFRDFLNYSPGFCDAPCRLDKLKELLLDQSFLIFFITEFITKTPDFLLVFLVTFGFFYVLYINPLRSLLLIEKHNEFRKFLDEVKIEEPIRPWETNHNHEN
ncbi:hypothetical protein ACN08Z_07425, partial [Rothia sp. P7181]|uniref:hypothetical protein n=1 Tax=Rothia sp. P7181 TaxID=3402663 RepID=UPI003ADCCB9B